MKVEEKSPGVGQDPVGGWFSVGLPDSHSMKVKLNNCRAKGTQTFIITYKGKESEKEYIYILHIYIFSYIKEYIYTHCACVGIYILLCI